MNRIIFKPAAVLMLLAFFVLNLCVSVMAGNAEFDNLQAAYQDSTTAEYILNGNAYAGSKYIDGVTVADSLGQMGEGKTSFTLTGNGESSSIVGHNTAGGFIVNENQTLNLSNIGSRTLTVSDDGKYNVSVSYSAGIYNFGSYINGTTAITNSGTVNIDNTVFYGINGDVIQNAGNIKMSDNVSFFGTNSSGTQRGIVNNEGGSVNIGDNLLIHGMYNNVSSSNPRPGSGIANYGDIEIGSNAVIYGNGMSSGTDYSKGGAIYNEGTLKFGEGALFRSNGNTVNYGGAIYSTGDLEIGDNSVFNNNYAYNAGGAIYNEGTAKIGDNVIFISNQTNSYSTTCVGGAIYNSGTMEIGDNVSFENNYSPYGGAIYNADGASLTIGTGAKFTGNKGGSYNVNTSSAIYNGVGSILNIGDGAEFSNHGYGGEFGTIVNNGGNVTIGENVVFANNKFGYYSNVSSMNGVSADIVSKNNGTVTIGNNAQFIWNVSSYDYANRGAIFNDGGGDIIIGNNLTIDGKRMGIASNSGDITIGENATFQNIVSYKSANNGEYGAIYNTSSNSVLTIGKGAKFINNYATESRAILYNASTSKLTLENVTFNYNSAYRSGGMYIPYLLDTKGDLDLKGDSTFTNNGIGTYNIYDNLIYAGGGVNIDKGSFTENLYFQYMVLANNGNITIGEDSEISKNASNSSVYYTYLFFAPQGDIEVGDNVKFTENTGGTVLYTNLSDKNITIGDNVLFDSNKTFYNSDMVHASSGDISIGDNVTFNNNYANGFMVNGKSGEIGDNLTFTDNECNNCLLYFYDGDVSIGKNAKFDNNKSGGGPGIALVSGNAVSIDDGLTATNNTCTGAYLIQGTSIELGDDIKFLDNTTNRGLLQGTTGAVTIGKNAKFDNNTLSNCYGGIRAATKLTIGDDLTVTNNTVNGDCLIKVNSGDLSIGKNFKFSDNNQNGNFTINAANITIGDNAEFKNNSNSSMSIMYAGTNVTLGNNVTFDNNVCGGNGPCGVVGAGGTFSVRNDFTFTNNISGGSPLFPATTIIAGDNFNFSNNTSKGAQMINATNMIVGDNAKFTGNYSWNCPVIYSSQKVQIGNNAQFEDNYGHGAGPGGGALSGGQTLTYVGDSASFKNNNISSAPGAAIYARGATIVGKGATFENNYSYVNGGAIYNYSSNFITIDSADFKGNVSPFGVGAIYQGGGPLTVIDSSFENNIGGTEGPALHGGAIYVAGGGATIIAQDRDVVFTGNRQLSTVSHETVDGKTTFLTSGGESCAIYSTGAGTYLNPGKSDIIFNDRIEGNFTINASGRTYTNYDRDENGNIKVGEDGYYLTKVYDVPTDGEGAVVFNNEVASVTGAPVQMYGGTVKFGIYEDENDSSMSGHGTIKDFFIINKSQASGNIGTIDLVNNLLQNEDTAVNLGNQTIIQSDVNLKLDADLASQVADVVTGGSTQLWVNDGANKIIISSINFTSETDKTEFEFKVSDENLMSAIKLGSTLETTNAEGITENYVLTYESRENDGGYVVGEQANLVNVTRSETKSDKNYIMFKDESVTDDLNVLPDSADKTSVGTLAGNSLNITGNGHTINGDNKQAISLGDSQTLGLKDVNVNNFETALNNNEGGTVNLVGVSFSGNKTDLENKGTVNVNSSTTFTGDVKGENGTINLNEGTTTFKNDVEGNTVVVNKNATLKLQSNINNGGLTANGGGLSSKDGKVAETNLGKVTIKEKTNLSLDFDLGKMKSDSFKAEVENEGGVINVNDIKISGTTLKNGFKVHLGNTTKLGQSNVTSNKMKLGTIMTPIRKLDGQLENGWLTFAPAGNKYKDFNPAVVVAPVAAQLGGYFSQLQSYDEAFNNLDMKMLMTREERMALKFANKYSIANQEISVKAPEMRLSALNTSLDREVAALDFSKKNSRDAGEMTLLAAANNTETPIVYSPTIYPPEQDKSLWFRPYATFERVNMKNGPHVSNILYGSYFGGESQMYELKRGWDFQYSAYVGYNGSHQAYQGNDIYQNGGTFGVTGMWFKGNFFTALTANVGASVAEGSTMYGSEDFPMLMSGVASKTGYNFEFARGRFIIQPSYLMSYTFVNTFDYTNAAGARINSDPLHAINIAPGLKFIGNLKNGWQPYLSVKMVWNIMDKTDFMAANTALPDMSIKPYIEYGLGLQRRWGDRFTGYVQAMIRNGGRNGVALGLGLRWAIGR